MTTIKEILSENRDSVISSIKFLYKVYNINQIKPIMVQFLNYMDENYTIKDFEGSKRIKSDLKECLKKMKFYTAPKKEKKSVAELRADYMDRNNLEFDLRTKQYYKI